MKNLLILIFVLVTGKASAQGFEGTMKWSMKMEITDPAKKVQFENAQKQMSDPANQAKMKEMQERMKDPQFKAMMESNPQIKAQLEKAMGALQTGDLNAMIPKGITIKVKNKNVLSKIEGGMFSGETLYLKDKDKAYLIDREKKTYSLVSQPEKTEKKEDLTAKVTKTKETANVLNYTCTKYIVEMQSNGQTLVQNVWATSEIKDFDMSGLAKQRVAQQSIFHEKIDGVPLKMDMKMQDYHISMEVTEIKKEPLPASDFTIPAGFTETASAFK